MSDVVIKVENLGKRYRLGLTEVKHENFTSQLLALLKYPITNYKKLRRLNKFSNEDSEDVFWALKDINFEIRKGEMVGIIGRNGAGKSTLLKILSRITEPTHGRITTVGRVSSLLEVGTGFHHDLSGRENVYMNGTILGMSKSEIDKKFDEIVAFSGVEKFIDTPVKRYSSGMRVRLAFSVAAHLEPEILIIDEVLSVGDSAFQAQCIDKMTEVAKNGRTILFVSHNLATIKTLCNRGILLSSGRILMDDNIDNVIDKYAYGSKRLVDDVKLGNIERKEGENSLIFDSITFNNKSLKFGEKIVFTIKLKTLNPGAAKKDLEFGFVIKDKNFNPVIHISNKFIHKNFDHLSDQDEYCFEVDNILSPGQYFMNLFLRSNFAIQDWLKDIIKFEILEGNPYNYKYTGNIKGTFFPQFDVNVFSHENVIKK